MWLDGSLTTKVKILESYRADDLEDKINAYLRTDLAQLIDIKFTSTVTPDNRSRHSAMIIYSS